MRKKDGSLRFCIDFRKLNSLTVKDSHPLPRICETLKSLAGAAHYSTFDMNSGFWQVPMDEESKQYTAFTLGSMGLYECESMPFGLCNAPPTFQRLMLNCLGELNLTYCLIYLDDVIIFSWTEEEHLERMRVVFEHLHEHSLKLKPSKCDVFKTDINYLAHHVSKKGVLPSKKNLEAIAECPPLDTYTKVKSFVGLVGHYRRFIKGFANIAAPLYDLTSGENKDKKSEHLDLPPEAREAFDRLKAACLQAPILSFPDFSKPFLLETDASGKGLGAVLSQKQSDGRYHPIAYASRIINETEQRYHSNKQEFLALKWAVTEQFHEYLSPYGKNRNEFVVCMDNNPLTYIFSTANLNAAGQRWVAHLTSYNFTLEYQKGKDNTVAGFLSCMDDCLTEGEIQDYLSKIPYPGVKAVLDNAITPLVDRAEQGVWPNPACQNACQEETLDARPAMLATTNVTDWKLEQKEDPVLYQVVKHRKASHETFKEALLKVTDQKATTAYVKSKEQLIMRNGLLYRQSKQGPIKETVFQLVVPQIHRGAAGDVMVRTDGFVGKWKVKDCWEDGGFIVESQLEDWPVYKVRCPTTDSKQKPKYWILHRNCLLLVTNEDDTVIPGQQAQAEVTPTISNATLEASVDGEGSFEPLPSLVTQQEGDMTSQVWLNGEFRTKPWTQTMSKASESPPDQIENEVSDLKPDLSDSESEGM